jgi:uncharacterized protein (DUF433 family)
LSVHNRITLATDVLEAIPLARDEHGVYRVGGTRVTLDLVVRAFNRGATAEEIVPDFPDLQLSDGFTIRVPPSRSMATLRPALSTLRLAYAMRQPLLQTIGYYLKRSEELGNYFRRRDREEVELRAAQPEWSPRGLRDRLLARRPIQ